jgi:hypothetical protein
MFPSVGRPKRATIRRACVLGEHECELYAFRLPSCSLCQKGKKRSKADAPRLAPSRRHCARVVVGHASRTGYPEHRKARHRRPFLRPGPAPRLRSVAVPGSTPARSQSAGDARVKAVTTGECPRPKRPKVRRRRRLRRASMRARPRACPRVWVRVGGGTKPAWPAWISTSGADGLTR